MSTIGLYTPTENELGAIREAAFRLDGIDLAVRSESDLKDEATLEAYLETLESVDAAVFWLHGAKDSMPGYELATSRLKQAGVPLVVKTTGDPYALEDTTVSETDRERVYEYLERGGTVNFENCCRYLASEYGTYDGEVDGPVALPTEGVYHPDHPAVEYEELLESHDADRPTVGVWFYESHWTHANTRYVDTLVRALEAKGVNVLPTFCNPATDEAGQKNAKWVAENWFSDDEEPIVDAVISSFMFSLGMSERGRSASDEAGTAGIFLEELGVPILQAITTMRSRSRYEASDTGVMGFELALSVALPEFDGNVITHPISGKEHIDDEAGIDITPKRHLPIEDRVEHVASLAVNWAGLRYTPNEEKQIAVVLHNYPPSDDGIGTAFGLDSPESTINLLEELETRGYDLENCPDNGQELIEELTAQLTLENRWVAPEDVRALSVDMVSAEQYAEWFTATDERFQEHIVEEWGEPPERPFAIPGMECGNVLVTVQPPRGFGMDPSKVYHDSDLQPPHDYYAFYAWLREEYGADAVVHLGTHGSLEWLPGKTVGLNAESAPDTLVSDLPNVYPYIVNNPGEGTQAKRRSYAAIVDYLTPVMRAAGTYDDLADLEDLASEYRRAGMEDARSGDGEKLEVLLREKVEELDLAVELGITGTGEEKMDVRGPDEAGTIGSDGDVAGNEVDIDELVTRIHEYLTDVKTTQIRMGLHTMSEPPEGERLVEYLVALTRLANPGAPSLRESVAGALGFDYETMLSSPGTYDEDLGMTYAEAADVVHEQSVELIDTLAAHDFEVPVSELGGDPEDDVHTNPPIVDLETVGDARAKPGAHDDLRRALAFVCEEAAPRVRGAEDEIPRTADALEGQYVPPGGSGAPTRGGVDLLPTARNFYTLDPRKVPAKAAWHVGKEVAEDVLERHYSETEEYPEEIGVVAWGTPTIRTRGETIAQVLAMMGVEPVWTDAGRIDDVEPISLEELDRPRIDVTTRVSGLFRDAFPAAAGIIHDAVDTVVDLEEPHEMNYVKKHVEQEAETLEQKEGLEADEARDAVVDRVFTTNPGGYGAGTNKAVDEGNWDDRTDLASIYVQWGGYAMGSRGRASDAHDSFKRRLSSVDATVKLEDTMEQDEFDSSDWYAFHGGFISAVAEVSGEEPASYVGDSSDPDNVSVYTNEEKIRKSMRARVLNPDWLNSMEEHGYKGAGDLSTTVDVTLGWDAMTGVISDRLWEDVAEAYAFDEDRQEWMTEVNPWALESITATLLEAIDRELWGASEETEDRLRDINLSVEGEVEAKTTTHATGMITDD